MAAPPSLSPSSLDLDALLHERGLLDPRAYVDPDLHALEQERVFGRSWLLLTHESCLVSPGQYVTSTMGEDPVVVTRTEDGSIAAFLNQCRHRGVPICRGEAGRARSFTCSYHGWTYDTRGRLRTVPNEDVLFECPLDRDQWSATPVPRIETRHGLVFGCWDPRVPSLQEWLGDAAWYFDLAFDSPGGTEALVGVSRQRIAANWKFGAEQFAGDEYHFGITHASGWAAQQVAAPPDMPPFEHVPRELVHSTQGHGMGFIPGQDLARNYVGITVSMRDRSAVKDWLYGPRLDYLVERYGERARAVAPLHMNFFPNTGFLWPHGLRVWQPRGPTEMEVWAWLLVDRDAPDEVKDTVRMDYQRSFGAAGVFEVDDMHNWAEAQRVLAGWQTRRGRFNAQMRRRPGSLDLSGAQSDLAPSESGARRFHRRWAELISTAPNAGGEA